MATRGRRKSRRIQAPTTGSTEVLPWQERLVYSIRIWAARHAKFLEVIYRRLGPVIVNL